MKRRVTLSAAAVLRAGETPDLSFVPPLVRRRLSPLQKIYFSLARQVEGDPSRCTVFVSKEGEDSLTRRIVDSFRADGTVSPCRFSASVYNAAPGLWSVQTKNTAPYTAIAAGDDSIECGLLELLDGPLPALFVTAEEVAGGYGAAFRLEDAPQGRAIEIGRAPSAGEPISFEALASFLSGRTRALTGRWLTVREV